MGVVEIGACTQPGQQPVKGFFQRASPARTVERLDPHTRSIVQVSKRRVDFRLTMVIAARSGVPAMGARVVRIQLHALDRVSSASRTLLVEAADETTFLMPLEEWLEESRLGEGGSCGMVVVPYVLCLVAVFLPQCGQVSKHVIATACPKGLGEVRRPHRHRSKFILEGADDHVAEKVPDASLERAMHHRQERLAGGEIEVVKPTLDTIAQHEPMSTRPTPYHTPAMHRDGAWLPNGLAPPIDRNGERGNWRASLRTLQHASPFHVAGDALERLSGKPRLLCDEAGLHVRAGEAELIIEPEGHPQCSSIFTDAPEYRPPFLRKVRRIFWIRAIQWSGWCQIQDEKVVHSSLGKPLKLPA